MSKSKLALFGGPKVREHLFPSQNTYGTEEMQAVTRVMKEGRLSGYRANWGLCFYGGPEIKALEKEWAARFNTKHAIACNSATSGLFIACGAVDVTGKEVIVSPYSMTCSATMPLAWGGIPVFADVEEDCFCLDPVSVEAAVTENTKAIIAVSLFGQVYDPKINEIAKHYGLMVIEDAAQAPGAKCYDSSPSNDCLVDLRYAGTLGHIGVYSFNFGKHMNCGEGGIIVTDNDELAFRCRLLMNHGESIQNDQPEDIVHWPGLFGFNLRLTEICAAIIREQLKKFDVLLHQRLKNVEFLNSELQRIPAITPAKIRQNCTHTYYVAAYHWDKEKADGLYRDKFIEAVKAELSSREGRDEEGCPIGCGYIKPINQMSVFQSRGYSGKGSLPIVERLYEEDLFLTLLHAPNSTIEDIQDVSAAFHKVWENRKELL